METRITQVKAHTRVNNNPINTCMWFCFLHNITSQSLIFSLNHFLFHHPNTYRYYIQTCLCHTVTEGSSSWFCFWYWSFWLCLLNLEKPDHYRINCCSSFHEVLLLYQVPIQFIRENLAWSMHNVDILILYSTSFNYY